MEWHGIHGIIRNDTEVHGIICNHTEVHGIIWNYMELYGKSMGNGVGSMGVGFPGMLGPRLDGVAFFVRQMFFLLRKLC